MDSQRREQGRIALSWEDIKEILIAHFKQSGDIPLGTCDLTIEVDAAPLVDDDGSYLPMGEVEIRFASVWDKKLDDESVAGTVFIDDLDSVIVGVKKVLESLRGHVNVLRTHNDDDVGERGRIRGWIEAHEYLERLVLTFAGVNPDRPDRAER